MFKGTVYKAKLEVEIVTSYFVFGTNEMPLSSNSKTIKGGFSMEISFVIIVAVSILVTFILDHIFKKKRYVKYIPVMIILPFMIYYFVTMYSASNESFESLGKFVMGLILLIASISSIIYSIIVDILHKRRQQG